MKTIMVKGCTEALHRRFKAMCAQEGISMQQQIINLIEAWLDRLERR